MSTKRPISKKRAKAIALRMCDEYLAHRKVFKKYELSPELKKTIGRLHARCPLCQYVVDRNVVGCGDCPLAHATPNCTTVWNRKRDTIMRGFRALIEAW
jgi:hypothetical protein